MNKAFVREPDAAEPLCPQCGALGAAALPQAVLAFAGEGPAQRLSQPACFCPTPSCPVAYFDPFEASIAVAELVRPAPPKDPAAPLCGCFGLTADDIAADLADGVPARIRRLREQAQSPAAQCDRNAPTGRCCLPEVQRCYFRLRGSV